MHERKVYPLMGEHEQYLSPSTPQEVSPFTGKSFLVIVSVGFSLATFTPWIFLQVKKTIHETTWVAHDLVLWPFFWNSVLFSL